MKSKKDDPLKIKNVTNSLLKGAITLGVTLPIVLGVTKLVGESK